MYTDLEKQCKNVYIQRGEKLFEELQEISLDRPHCEF